MNFSHALNAPPSMMNLLSNTWRRLFSPLLLTGATCVAQTPQLVLDIVPGPGSSQMTFSAVLGDAVLFANNTPEFGNELWRTDGTAAGTYLVKDIWPGPSSSNLGRLTTVGDHVYFSAWDGTNGTELWKSDGTEAGTMMVADLAPGSNSTFPQHITEANGGFYFSANGLFWSDGTEAGTMQVSPVNVEFGSGSYPSLLTVMNDMVYFVSSDAENGSEIWHSDGTAEGTTLLKDINWGDPSSYPGQFTVVGDLLYFKATDMNGTELWRTDGTEVGTWMAKDINEGPANGDPFNLTAFNDQLVFSATTAATGRELWVSDGTEIGTVLVSEISAGPAGGVLAGFAVANDRVFFPGSDVAGGLGMELYAYDGSAIALVKDINPGVDSSLVSPFLAACGGMVFGANDGVTGNELWYSDGSEGGTFLLGEIEEGTGPFGPIRPFAALSNAVILSASTAATGYEPFVSFCGTVGLEALQRMTDLRMHPNPAKERFTIELPETSGAWTVTVYDATGKCMLVERSTARTLSVDAGAWGSGLYYVVANNGSTRVTNRLVVE